MRKVSVSQAQRKRFGLRVYNVRKHVRGLSLDAVVDAGGPSRGTMVKIEKARGSEQPPNFVLDKLDAALGLKEGSARQSLLNDTDLVLKDEPESEPEVTYTEEEVTRRRKFEAALERLGVTEVVIHKTSGEEGFVLSQQVIDQLTERLNALSDPEPRG